MQGVPEHGHEAVMVGEVLRGLGLVDGGAGKGDGGAAGSGRRVVMDCTVGRGGHAVRIVEAMGSQKLE